MRCRTGGGGRLARGLPVGSRTVLLQAAKQGKTAESIAKEHETSEQLARFLLNASGVLVQIGRAKAARHRQAHLSG